MLSFGNINAASQFLNGNFEAPQVNLANSHLLAPDNWVSVGTANGLTLMNNNYAPGALYGNAPFGSQYLLFQGSGVNYIAQTLEGFTIGVEYTIGFHMSSFTTDPATLTLFMSGASVVIQPFVVPGGFESGIAYDEWVSKSLTFTALDTSVAFMFMGNHASGLPALDKVSLSSIADPVSDPVEDPVSVPEPSTALVGFCLAGVAASWRRRSYKA